MGDFPPIKEYISFAVFSLFDEISLAKKYLINEGAPMMAGSLNKLNKKGLTADN